MTSNLTSSIPTEPATLKDHAKKLDQAVHAWMTQASMGLSPISLSLAYLDWAMHLASSPGQQMLLLQETWASLPQSLVASQEEKDVRFRHEAWQNWPFNVLKSSYQSQVNHWQKASHVEGMTDHHKHMVKFFTRQYLDAMSPSNWPLTNPEVMKKGLETRGESWVKGWQKYIADLGKHQKDQIQHNPETLENLDFEVGQDVAVTPGQVVFRNRLIELIQYSPTTDKVYAEPVLMVPSCIMKYYILDLSPHNSMVKYLVDQGHTVFMISWRNPDESDRDLGMDDYLRLGVMAAMSAIKSQTGEPRLHALGYCLGGTFLAIVAAVLAQQKPKKLTSRISSDMPELASVSLLAAQTDFSEPGELGVFIDDDQLKNLTEDMAKKGYLSGRQMAGAFQFLNSRDLIWSRNTHRYLLGEDEIGMDMMSWNADTTRLPERMHSEYLHTLFLHDSLAKGHYKFEGQGVALMNIKAPLLMVGTVRDHVSPWQSVYKIHLLTDTDTTFILAAGGHNAGIISEPGHANRSYQMNHAKRGQAWLPPEAWEKEASRHEGSWWVPMQSWLAKHSGALIKARKITSKNSLCDAPGEYVKVRYVD
jgi:polyhydroxyalkanoate synthase